MGTVRINHTLWAAVRGRADHLRQTAAVAAISILCWRMTVRPTGVWITWIISNNWLNCQWWLPTGSERVSNVTTLASAGWDVVDHPAEGVSATQARARIHTVELLTGLVCGAIRIDCALRPASHIGISKIFRNASA